MNSAFDSHKMILFHDRKAGIFTFVFHQALHSMGPNGVFKGFSLISYIVKNGTNVGLMSIFKCGIRYPDTSLSLRQPGSRLDSDEF